MLHGQGGSWQPSWLVPAEMAQQLWLWEQGLHVVYPSLLAFSVSILGQKALKWAGGGGGLILQKRK